MKRPFLLLAILVVFCASCAIVVAMVQYEGKMEAVQKFASSFIVVVLTLIGQILVKQAKKDVYGGWIVEIEIDGSVVDDETENLDPVHGEILIGYYRAWWIVYFFGGQAFVHRTLSAERVLRQCCESLGGVRGNVHKDISLDNDRKVVTMRLRRMGDSFCSL